MNAQATAFLLNKYGKKNPPHVKAGDTVRVHQSIKEGNKERVQIFEGLVIATKHGQGLDGSFTVRKIGANSIGVERTYPVHSPNVIKVERIKNAEVSRAKLYYMRDRKGKAARFKNEGPSYETWDEAAAVAALAAEMAKAEEEAAKAAAEAEKAEEPEVVAEEAPAEEVAATEGADAEETETDEAKTA